MTLRETIARAIELWEDRDGLPTEWDDLPEARRRMRYEQADAVLAALEATHAVVPREPTEAMRAAAMEAALDYLSTWRAMVAAAEREPK